MLTKPATKRTTLIFFALTICLSAVNYWLASDRYKCIKSDVKYDRKEVKYEKGADILSGNSLSNS